MVQPSGGLRAQNAGARENRESESPERPVRDKPLEIGKSSSFDAAANDGRGSTASAGNVSVIAAPDTRHLTFVAAEVKVAGRQSYWQTAGDGGTVKRRAFCPTCGSPSP